MGWKLREKTLNACGIADELGRQCPRDHSHVHLVNGRAERAEVYPDELCYRILNGLIKTMKRDVRPQPGHVGSVLCEDEFVAFDDNRGHPLDHGMVREARAEEMTEVCKHKLYTKVRIQECWDKTGKNPVSVRWVDTDRGI